MRAARRGRRRRAPASARLPLGVGAAARARPALRLRAPRVARRDRRRLPVLDRAARPRQPPDRALHRRGARRSRWRGRRRARTGSCSRGCARGAGGRADVRRVALARRGGRFHRRPAFYRRASCGAISSFKLERPVFGGRSNRAVDVTYRLGATARVRLRAPARQARRPPPRSARRVRQGGRAHRIRIAAGGPAPRRLPGRAVRSGGRRTVATADREAAVSLRAALTAVVIALAAGGSWLAFGGTDECRAQAGGGDVEARPGCASSSTTACAASAGFVRAAARAEGAARAVAIHAQGAAAGHGRGVPVLDRAADPRQPPDRALHRPQALVHLERPPRARRLPVRALPRRQGRATQRACRRRGGRFARGKSFYRRASCATLAQFKLERPVFGGPRNRALGIAYRVGTRARVTRGRAARQEGRAPLPRPHGAAGRDRAAAAGVGEAAARPPPGDDHRAAGARRDAARLAVCAAPVAAYCEARPP